MDITKTWLIKLQQDLPCIKAEQGKCQDVIVFNS